MYQNECCAAVPHVPPGVRADLANLATIAEGLGRQPGELRVRLDPICVSKPQVGSLKPKDESPRSDLSKTIGHIAEQLNLCSQHVSIIFAELEL